MNRAVALRPGGRDLGGEGLDAVGPLRSPAPLEWALTRASRASLADRGTREKRGYDRARQENDPSAGVAEASAIVCLSRLQKKQRPRSRLVLDPLHSVHASSFVDENELEEVVGVGGDPAEHMAPVEPLYLYTGRLCSCRRERERQSRRDPVLFHKCGRDSATNHWAWKRDLGEDTRALQEPG